MKSGLQARGDFEIGRIQHLKSEIADWTVQLEISDFGFEVLDSSNLEIPLSLQERDIPDKEKGREEQHQPVEFSIFAGCQTQNNIADEAECNPVRDTERERYKRYRDECGN